MEEASKGILEGVGVTDGPSGIDLLSPNASLVGKNQYARNKSTAEKQRKHNLMAFAEAHVQTAEKSMNRKRSTFRHKEMVTVQSQIINFSPPPLAEDAPSLHNIVKQVSQDDRAYFDYNQKHNEVGSSSEFKLKIRSVDGSPNSKLQDSFLPRSTAHILEGKRPTDDLLMPRNGPMLISQGSTDFANISGAGQVNIQPEDKIIVINKDGGTHMKTHSSASDYMEFEADKPVVGYSPSHAESESQKVIPKDKFEQLKERLAEHHQKI